MCWRRHFLLQSAGVSQCQAHVPSVPPGGPSSFQWTGGCVCFGRHGSTKRGGLSFYPCFDPSIERTQAWPSLSVPPAWMAGLMAETGGYSEPATPAEWAYWRGNRLALRVPDGDPPLLPAGPPFSPSLFQPTKGNPCISMFLIKLVVCSGFKRVAETIVG